MFQNKMIRHFAVLGALVLFASCASMRNFNAMSQEEKAEYIAIAQKMTVKERKTYLAKGNLDARLEYLKELGIFEEYVENAAFTRLEEEKRQDFLKAYLLATPEERQAILVSFDEDTQDRIKVKDLQFGWSNREVILSLGKPNDILENRVKDKCKQLWIYDNQEVATFLYFEDGKLTNWAN